MIAPEIPVDEAERLTELRALNILDTPPEERFDRLVRLASSALDVPIAYVAMVDADRQWFKSKCGLDADQTTREVSFCGHTILQREPLIILDTTRDQRFHDNPMVTGDPFIRFYAGFPLAGPDGHNVGTLCIADRQPREFPGPQRDTMSELARLAEDELDMLDTIASQRQLIETQQELVRTQDKLRRELADAAAYVRSLLPARLTEGPVCTDYAYLASSELGGDLFGYHWRDDRHLTIYLLDVCGHGVGASLLSSAAYNALRREALADTDFADPAAVLEALNRAFPIEENAGKFFTIWYGVYDRIDRTLRYAAAGHHPAVLFNGDDSPQHLGEAGFMIGVTPDPGYETAVVPVEPDARIYLFSDGAFELRRDSQPDGEMLGLDGFDAMLCQRATHPRQRIDAIINDLREYQNGDDFPDDVSLIEAVFA